MTVCKRWLPLLALAGLGLLEALPVDADDRKPRKTAVFTLKRVPLKPGALRLGPTTSGTVPNEAWSFKLGQRTFLLLDLDGDGKITPGGDDGLALAGSPFVVPLPRTLLCESGQCELEVTTGHVKLTREELAVDPELLIEASELTEIRIRAGLAPVRIDVAACRACEAHCDYLQANGEADGHGGVSMHVEKQGNPGYTKEGAVAGEAADLFPKIASFRGALWDWYATVWHGAPMFNPGVSRVGIALRYDVAALYFVDPAPVLRPLPHPPEGAVNVPVSFGSRGEVPNPVFGTDYAKGCGFPILVILPSDWSGVGLDSFTVADPHGKKIAGTVSCPSKPATQEWPTNSGCAAFIPTEPLPPNAKLMARLAMIGHEAVVWSFSTASERK